MGRANRKSSPVLPHATSVAALATRLAKRSAHRGEDPPNRGRNRRPATTIIHEKDTTWVDAALSDFRNHPVPKIGKDHSARWSARERGGDVGLQGSGAPSSPTQTTGTLTESKHAEDGLVREALIVFAPALAQVYDASSAPGFENVPSTSEAHVSVPS